VEIHELPVHRGRVELEVSCMHDQPHRSCYAQSHSVNDAMGHPYEFY
jgi:hypothetical protein